MVGFTLPLSGFERSCEDTQQKEHVPKLQVIPYDMLKTIIRNPQITFFLNTVGGMFTIPSHGW